MVLIIKIQQFLLIIIFWETIFSVLFDEYKVQKNSIYVKL